MNKNLILKVIFLIILLTSFFLFYSEKLFANIFYDNNLDIYSKNEYDNISIVVNFHNLTKNKHILFNKTINKYNTKKKFYFIKTREKYLDPNLYSLIENSSIKIIQSNFPDSFYLPLVVSLYGINMAEFVLFIEGDDIVEDCGNNLTKWIDDAYKKIMENKYDYIFGNSKIINGKKIGCSILFSKTSIIEHLLYYTDSDTTHANPFIQLSLSKKTKFYYMPFYNIRSSNLENINGRLSLNMNCPLINDSKNISLCIILPNFKRNYFYNSFPAFSKQTYKPKFYLIIQNENKIYYNISLIQRMVNEPVYHIWMQNWNSFFFLPLRFSSIIPCDFVLKYDDDQWPLDNLLQEKLINFVKNKNVIVGKRGFSVKQSYCGYSSKNYIEIESNKVDHVAVPLLMRPNYIKLDARNKIYRLYGGEDIALCLNSYKLCNVTSEKIEMNITEKQTDGNNQLADKQIINEYKKEKKSNFNLFEHIYCYLIHSGYIPRSWKGFKIPEKDYINITINHKVIN